MRRSVVTLARLDVSFVAALALTCAGPVAHAQDEGFTIPSTRPETIVSAVGECSMGDVRALIEPNAPFNELLLTVLREPRQQLRLEVDAVEAGRIVGRFADGEICLLRIVMRRYNPGVMDPFPPTEQRGV